MAKLATDTPSAKFANFPGELSRAIRRKVVNSMAKAGLPAKKLPISPIGFDEVRWPHAKPRGMV